VALQQHFGDARRRAEVAVNLERPAQVKKIWQRPLLQQASKLAKRKLAVADARPERNAPRKAPAGAAFAAPFQQNFCGGKKIGVGRCDVRAGIQRPERRHVAMIVVWRVHVFEPLLKLAVFADLIGRDVFSHVDELRDELFVGFQKMRG